VFPRFRCM